MDLWQEKASEELTAFLGGFLKIEKVIFTGSILDPKSLDMFSDVDITVYLADDYAFQMKELIDGLLRKFDVFGYETYSHDDKDLLRICFATGWRFDLSIIHNGKNVIRQADYSFEDAIDVNVNKFWFIAVMVLVKLGRNDYLIASHLALELCQLTIVSQMLVRDQVKNTNIHRFGDMEDVPILHSLSLFDNTDDTEGAIIRILYMATERMDVLSEDIYPGYIRKSGCLKTLLGQ